MHRQRNPWVVRPYAATDAHEAKLSGCVLYCWHRHYDYYYHNDMNLVTRLPAVDLWPLAKCA